MKKVLIVYGALVVLIIIVVVLRFRGIDLFPFFRGGEDDATVTIEDQTFTVEVADEDEERFKGLTDRDSLDRDRGMVFIFEEKTTPLFWMRNVNFPLDIIFISDNTIVSIAKNAEPQSADTPNIPSFEPPEPINYVLEINGGLSDELGIEVGDTVTFEGIN